MQRDDIERQLIDLAALYPDDMVAEQLRDVRRIADHIDAAIDGRDPASLSVADIGGGVGLFSLGCAAIGMKRVVLIDDFRDDVSLQRHDSGVALHRQHGVEVIARDVVAEGLAGVDGDFSTITCFEAMEHWHHSPKRTFHEAVRLLTPGGRLLIGVPNSVDFVKRVTVPLGIGTWSAMGDWYDVDVFRGHVREPRLADLRYIADDLGLVDVEYSGRNWNMLAHPRPAVRAVGRGLDPLLRLRPSLCSSIYVLGRTPE